MNLEIIAILVLFKPALGNWILISNDEFDSNSTQFQNWYFEKEEGSCKGLIQLRRRLFKNFIVDIKLNLQESLDKVV